jgi:Glycosyl transferase family 2
VSNTSFSKEDRGISATMERENTALVGRGQPTKLEDHQRTVAAANQDSATFVVHQSDHFGSERSSVAAAEAVPNGHITSVSLVIPAKNEAANIAWLLQQIPDYITEVILVDGHSTDVTLANARYYRPDIRIVPQRGQGKGAALRTGFLAATGDVIVMMDADGSMSPQEISHYLYFLANGYDFVKGSRFVGGGGSADITRLRSLGNRFLLELFNRLYDAHLTDLCYGFCAFHRRYLEYLKLEATGFEIEAEMTVRAMQAGLRIAEVPSFEMPRRAGNSNLHAVRDGTRVLRTVVRDHKTGLSGHLVQSVRKRFSPTGYADSRKTQDAA